MWLHRLETQIPEGIVERLQSEVLMHALLESTPCLRTLLSLLIVTERRDEGVLLLIVAGKDNRPATDSFSELSFNLSTVTAGIHSGTNTSVASG
jgi:hypothetical protein